MQNLPLFPLGIVLMPHEVVPLHIFEERYLAMVEKCLTEDSVFGLVYTDGKEVHRVGCTASVIDLVRRNRDGSLDIVIRGENRFSVKRFDTSDALLRAEIQIFHDADEPLTPDLGELAARGLRAARILDMALANEEATLSRVALERASFLLAAAPLVPPQSKLNALESRSLRQRLEMLAGLLELLAGHRAFKGALKRILRTASSDGALLN